MQWFPSKILYQTDFTKQVLNDEVPVYPHMIELWLTDRCNLNCYWCVEKETRKNSPGDWDLEVLKQRLTEFAAHGTKAVTLEGGGEPTLYPYLEELTTHIASLGMDMGLTTNGVVIPNDNVLSKMKWVRLSLDAPNAEAFKQVKGVDKFDQVMSNVKEYGIRCKELGPIFGISYVITPFSKDVEPLLQELVTYKGIDYIQIKSVTESDDYIPVNEDTFGWTKKYNTDTMDVYIFDCFPGNDGVGCITHPITSTVVNNGDILFCKRLKANPKYANGATIIGNIYKNTVEEVYKGSKRKEFSDLVKDKEFCIKECPSCRLSKYNYVLWNMKEQKTSTSNFL